MKRTAFATLLLAAFSVPAIAAPVINVTEVASYASGDAAYAADWFEVTNLGNAATSISGWKVDDSSNSFANALALRGISSIAAGESVIFMEGKADGTTDASLKNAFLNAWFGNNAPASLQVGFYGGSGIGLSTSGDAVNMYDALGTKLTGVTFGAATTGKTFDNAAGAISVSQLSVIGTNGAFTSFNGAEIGSPGTIAAVPEPETFVLLLAGLSLVGFASRQRKL